MTHEEKVNQVAMILAERAWSLTPYGNTTQWSAIPEPHRELLAAFEKSTAEKIVGLCRE